LQRVAWTRRTDGEVSVRIAQIAPLCEAVPPRLYGGTERVVAHLCDALVDAGHEVTLFAAADARTRATLVPVRDQALRLDPSPLRSELAAHLSLLDEVRRRADQFDLLHFHLDLLQMPMFADCAARTLTTLHGRLDLQDLPQALARWPQFPLVAISDRQRATLPNANWAGTVHHGLDARMFGFSPAARGGYLAFLGRISPEKRLDRAIAIAARAGLPLRIAAKVDAADRDYFTACIEPLLDTPGVDFMGEIGDADKSRFLGDALALLFPIDWPEPFGLVMIEAMACGTPVVGWDCGSVPEVIDDGVTGRIVDSEDQAVAAVHEVLRFDRRRIREVFDRRFSSAAMATRYIELYWWLVQGAGTLRRTA
jgi:glycosyltransferase involved in cell wall biosynthesis